MVTTLHLVEKTEQEQRVVWEAYPAWAQFSWLFFLSALSALRAAFFFRFGVTGWEVWLWGAGLLIACAALLRRWAHYELTRDQLTVRNGYTGHDIHAMSVGDIRDVTVQQGVVAGVFGIGTLSVHSRATDRVIALRGVLDPEEVKIRIEALAWKHNRTVTTPHSTPV